MMKNNIKKREIDKQEFLELYENSKKGNVDLLTLPPETLKEMCKLLEEELKIKEKYVESLKAKLDELAKKN